ncbi:MAG: Na/Pi cotransporter family protein [Desulfobacterium sp.]|jgi:phosphate:Na+ symporter|nr:Na/Pi cotransporter family protein [Desulfobacterium sp.]
MSIYDFFTLLGGLAMFLFGMKIMGESMEKRAGSRLKPLLEQLTSHPLKAVLLGAGVTAVIQSSSGTTVMAVGFVNSGIMQLRQAIGVVMGANIGTTITSWVLSMVGIQSSNFFIMLLKPSTFSPLLAFAGIIMLMSGKRHKDTAGILLGFAVLMFGMEQMSGAVKSLSDNAAFVSLLTKFKIPLFGVLAGAIVTGILQSSSASVGILQALSLTGSLSYGAALPIIMGQNIGTCITSILSSIGANRNAKRVAAAHLSLNLIGTAIFLILFYLLDAFLHFNFVHDTVNPFGIAVIHSVFNIASTSILYPFIGVLEKIALKLIPDDNRGELTVLLDDRFLATPSIAIEQCRKQTLVMAMLSRDALLKSDTLLNNFDSKIFELVIEIEKRIDQYKEMLGNYLIKINSQSLSQAESLEIFKLLNMIVDIKRISDHALNLGEAAEEMENKGLNFSSDAQSDLAVMRRAVRDVLNLTVESIQNNNISMAEQVEPLEEVVDTLHSSIKAGHIRRLQRGDSTLESGFVLSNLLNNLERVSDHCSNLAASLIETDRSGHIHTHAYLKTLRMGESGQRFQARYEEYLNHYPLSSQEE